MSRLLKVTSSPGFAAEFNWGDEYTVGNKIYGKINGCFNENYATEDQYKGYKWFYHEGLDLRGPLGMEIHSFIYAQVIAYGWYERYGKTIILRNLSGIGVYLLAHLSEYMENIEVGVTVIPGQVVGKTGESGQIEKPAGIYTPDETRFSAHLHIITHTGSIVDTPSLSNTTTGKSNPPSTAPFAYDWCEIAN